MSLEKYKNDYKTYYDEIIKKVNKGTNTKKSYKSTSEDIYPRTNYSGGSYYYSRGTVKNNKSSMKIGYINKFILRLILTFIIFLGAFSLKILDTKETKILYNKTKEMMNKSYGFENIKNIENTMKKLNIDYEKFVANIEGKYEKVFDDIKVINIEE